MPLGERIMVRETGMRESLLLGILHFPAAFPVKETALYLLMVVGEWIYVDSACHFYRYRTCLLEAHFPTPRGTGSRGLPRSRLPR